MIQTLRPDRILVACMYYFLIIIMYINDRIMNNIIYIYK